MNTISVSGLFMLIAINASFTKDFTDISNFEGLSSLLKIYCLFVCLKVLTVFLIFGRRMPIIKTLLQVISKAFVLCKSLYEMLFILLLLFSAIGMCLFGGNITSNTAANYKKILDSD